jgi:hypothetical protein
MMRTVLIEGVMPKSLLRFLFLMFITLNHAVSACESLVMHLPDENHPFSVLDGSSHQQMPQHQHANVGADVAANHSANHIDGHGTGHDTGHTKAHASDHTKAHAIDHPADATGTADDSQCLDDEHHAAHAHVSCHISPMQGVNGDPAVGNSIFGGQYALITTSYTPDVPPPNL